MPCEALEQQLEGIIKPYKPTTAITASYNLSEVPLHLEYWFPFDSPSLRAHLILGNLQELGISSAALAAHPKP